MSEVAICNRALGWIGAKRITSLGDASKEANTCNETYEASRDFVLADADWRFATKRFQLLPSAASPEFGYANKFLIPSEILRVITVNETHVDKIAEADWDIENGFIVSDDATVNVRAVVRVTDTALFSPGFVMALSARIAADICMPLTSSKSRMDQMEQKYGYYLRRAKSQDGRQGKSRRLKSRWIDRRRFSGTRRAGPIV